jgi:hypothetical protein
MSLGRIEAYLYATGIAGQFAASADLTVTETTGPVSFTAVLAAPSRLADALLDWQAQLNASVALANTYTLTWNATAQAVTIARATGASTFTVALGGGLNRALGFASASLSPAATSFTGTVQSKARFDNVRVDVSPVRDGGKVDLTTYRHGRAESLAFGTFDLHEVKLLWPYSPAGLSAGGAAVESCCIAGKIRLTQDSSLGYAWSYDAPAGYIDGHVLAVSKLETVGVAEQWLRVRMLLAVPR